MEWVKSHTRIPIKSWCRDADKEAMRQAEDLAELTVTFGHVAIMPDCHVGYGMPIGGVIACENAVIPNAVGVDIGCGVSAVQTDFPSSEMRESLIDEILREVRRVTPVGFDHRKRPQAWEGWDDAPLKSEPVRRELESAKKQLGTLGGGNHFMEIQSGEDGFVWLMIHSGSRNFGLKIAEHYHRLARRLCEQRDTNLPSPDLAYLRSGEAEAEEYLAAMDFALGFARRNRELMIESMSGIVRGKAACRITHAIDIHHNYCSKETHFGKEVMVHRKGATSARKGQMGVIPGSMGTPSYIVRGLGNPESFMSCSHGAGRCLGRKQANRVLSLEECNAAMRGIVFGKWGRGRKGKPDLSEAPQAYKNIEKVIAAQTDLIEVITRLRPLGVVKG